MKYAASEDFREAIEQRLKNASMGRPPAHLNRMRRLIVFERMLARFQEAAGEQWILKGGVALDFRLANRARFTRDLDLASDASEPAIVTQIVEASGTDLDDYFVFHVEDQGSIVRDGDKHALRFRIRAELAGRRFEIVSIDVGLGTHLTSVPDTVRGSDCSLSRESDLSSVQRFRSHNTWLRSFMRMCTSMPGDGGAAGSRTL